MSKPEWRKEARSKLLNGLITNEVVKVDAAETKKILNICNEQDDAVVRLMDGFKGTNINVQVMGVRYNLGENYRAFLPYNRDAN